MNKFQLQATDPNYSVWVLASAGTGKTKILTDRILRLLLSDVEFNKILCLTFTNAGANEMQVRLTSKLQNWSLLDDKKLTLELKLLSYTKVSTEFLKKAKGLYKSFLSMSNRIHIHTIHSYCQKILKRFPLEADVNPGFQIIDDILQRKVIHKLYISLFLNSSNAELIKYFICNFHESTVHEILEEIIAHRLKFKNMYFVDSSHYIKKTEELENNKNVLLQSIKNEANKLSAEFSKELSELGILDIIIDIEGDKGLNEDLLLFFLTKEGNKRARLFSKKLAGAHSQITEKIYEMQNSVHKFDQIIKTQKIYNYSRLLFEFATEFLNIYEEYKLKHNLLDYDDLIYYTNNLLQNSDAREWVLYKLDGGIDHLLIDESQDTSFAQWQIIQNLIEEFYSGEGKVGKKRSIFVVGDEKQSIFSFQGADLEMFYLMNSLFEKRIKSAKRKFKIITLLESYRSAPAITCGVYNIFAYIKNYNPNFFQAANPKIKAFRNSHYGSVELWPLINPNKPCDFFWMDTGGQQTSESHVELATKIAIYIKDQIESKTILSSTNKPASAQDFLILIRSRGVLATEIINRLKEFSLPTAGIDRLIISDNLSVLDLLSLAKFVLNPHDDLNLASLLKSPFIGLPDNMIETLLANKNHEVSLWSFMYSDVDSKFNTECAVEILINFIDLYNSANAFEFFLYALDYYGYRKNLLVSNSSGDNDAINELLYLASSYINNASASLQGFVYWLLEHDIEVKRNLSAGDNIRIMTIHNSKGLEAPIVILCDTTTVPVDKQKFYWQEGLCIASESNNNAQILKQIKEDHKRKKFEEYLRLLYVAITRPCDRLIICGANNEKEEHEHSWYALTKGAMQNFAQASEDGSLKYQVNNRPSVVINTFKQGDLFDDNKFIDIDYTNLRVEVDSSPFKQTLRDNDENYLNSPLISKNNLLYGKIFHKLLEDSINTGKFNAMSTHPLIKTLPSHMQGRMLASIKNLKLNKEFTDLLSQEVKTELNIGMYENNSLKVGRIDLLSISKSRAVIIDYKTDLKLYNDVSTIPQNYLHQLQSYKNIIKEIYSSKQITCRILWLENGTLSAELQV